MQILARIHATAGEAVIVVVRGVQQQQLAVAQDNAARGNTLQHGTGTDRKPRMHKVKSRRIVASWVFWWPEWLAPHFSEEHF